MIFLLLQELLDATHTILADLDRREHREPARPPRYDMRRVKSGAAAATQEKVPLQAPSEGAAAAASKGDPKKEKESNVEVKAEQKQALPPSASQVGIPLQSSGGVVAEADYPLLAPCASPLCRQCLTSCLKSSKGSTSACQVGPAAFEKHWHLDQGDLNQLVSPIRLRLSSQSLLTRMAAPTVLCNALSPSQACSCIFISAVLSNMTRLRKQ